MTLLVAFAHPDLALLASDTRTTFRPTTGDELDVSAVPASDYDDTGCKIVALGEAWLASGPSVLWREAMLAALAGVGDVRAAIRSWAPDAMRELEDELPAEARAVRERQITLVVGAGPDGCYRLGLNWDGSNRWPDDGRPDLTVTLFPVGADRAVADELLGRYQRTIKGAALSDVLWATGRLYRLVYQHCGPDGTMSPLVTLGLVRRHGRTLIGPLPHDALQHAAGALADAFMALQEVPA